MELLVNDDRRREIAILHLDSREAAAAESDFPAARARPREHAARLAEGTPVAVDDDELRKKPPGGKPDLLEPVRKRAAGEIAKFGQEAHARIAAQPRRRVGECRGENLLEGGAPVAREANGRRRAVPAGRLERSGEIQKARGNESKPHTT